MASAAAARADETAVAAPGAEVVMVAGWLEAEGAPEAGPRAHPVGDLGVGAVARTAERRGAEEGTVAVATEAAAKAAAPVAVETAVAAMAGVHWVAAEVAGVMDHPAVAKAVEAKAEAAQVVNVEAAVPGAGAPTGEARVEVAAAVTAAS